MRLVTFTKRVKTLDQLFHFIIGHIGQISVTYTVSEHDDPLRKRAILLQNTNNKTCKLMPVEV